MAGALDHYLSGTGTDLTMDFAWVNTSVGRHNLRIQGTLSTVCADGKCMWDFQGTVRSASGFDTYNMNASTGRSGSAEGLTGLGRNAGKLLGAKPFKILLPGSQTVNQGGEFRAPR